MSSRLARSFILINLSEVIFVLSGYAIHSYLGRLLNPAGYGRYSLIITFATMTIAFIADGIPKALSKFIAQYPQKEKIIKRKAALAQTLLITVVSIVYYLSAPLIAAFFKDQSLVPLIKLSTLIIPAFAAASFYNHYFNGLHLFHKQALQRGVRAITRLLVIIVLAYFWGIEGAIIGYIATPAIVAVFSYFQDPNRKKKITGDFPFKKMLNFGLGITLFMVAYNLVINIDLFLSKRLLSDYWVGIYNAAITIGRIPFYFFSSLAFILLPTISSLLEKETKKKATLLIKDSMRYLILLMLPTVAAIVVFAKQIINIIYSKEYLAAEPALQIFVVGVGALTLFFICTFILNGSGNVKTSMYITWVGFIINAVLNSFAIPRWGIIGSASSTAITSICLMLISLVMIKRNFGSFLNFVSLFKITLATLLSSLVFWFLPGQDSNAASTGWLLLFFIPFFTGFYLFYFILLTILKEINAKDFRRLKEVFVKKTKASA